MTELGPRRPYTTNGDATQVLIEGFIRFTDAPGNFRIPVVGGTGAYANARGYAHIRDIGPQDTDNSNIEFHLLP